LSSLAPWELAPRLPRSLRYSYIFVLSSPQPAPWQLAPWLPGSLASYRRTAVLAGFAGAGSPAPCELALYRRTVVVAADFVEAGSLWANVTSSCCRRVSRLLGSRLPGSVGAYVISSQPASWEPAPRLPESLHRIVELSSQPAPWEPASRLPVSDVNTSCLWYDVIGIGGFGWLPSQRTL